MRSRSAFILVLLGASFVVTLLITARALGEAIYRRTTAERAMRDFAGLALDEFVRDADAQVSFYACYPLAQKIAAGVDAAAPFARRTFRVNTHGVDPALPDDLRAALPDALRKRSSVVRTAKSTYYVGVTSRGDLPPFVGVIEVDAMQFAPFFADVLRMRRLMPPSIARGKVQNDALFIRVLRGGTPIFSTRGRFDPPLGVQRELTNDDGVLTGLTVETSISRSVAPLLVFGGLPQPMLGTYAVMLGINLLLVATAVAQLRRERVLAQLRSDFISGVSHELRTPLTQIRMFAETLLLDRVRNEEERHRSLTIIDQETRRLAHLVENILQFSRGERGTLRITKAPCDLAALVRETVETFAPIAKARGVTIEVDAVSSTIDLDEDAIRQVLLNLLDNAVKYGPPDQRIIVGVRGRELFVDDAGPGILSHQRDVVFQRYRRLERERARAIAGMGIGLSVVRELVELHGGRVRVEDSARGGARFVVTL